MVPIPDHMDVFYAVEIGFPFPNFFAVEVHLFVGCVSFLVELVDDQGRGAVDVEAFDSQFDG
jgi:hypothetical protein